MKLLNSIAKKLTKTVSETAVETVKVEAVKASISLLPVIGGIALGVIVGVVIYKSSSAKAVARVAKAAAPTISRTTITTYNYIFDASAGKLLVDAIIKK